MSASEGMVKTPAEQLRTLLKSSSGVTTEPDPEWIYRRDLRPRRLLRELWQARGIVRSVADRDLRVRYKQAVLGIAWSFLNPIGLLIALVLVFHRAVHINSGGIPYPLFAYCGLLPWTFFSNVLANAAGSIIGDKALLNKTYFPREIFPLATVVVAVADVSMASIALVGLFVAEHKVPSATAPLVILPILVLITLATGVALALSAAVVYARDARLGLPIVIQFGLFASPIGYAFTAVPHRYRLVYSILNPVAPVIDSVRRTLLMDLAPQWEYLGAGAVMAVTYLVLGFTVFKRLEAGFVDVA